MLKSYYAGQDLAKLRDFSALVIVRIEEREDEEPIARVVYVKQWPHVDYKEIIDDTSHLYEKFQWEMLGLDKGTVGEAVQRFNKVKEELGLKNNPDVIRHLIKVGYEQLVAKAK